MHTCHFTYRDIPVVKEIYKIMENVKGLIARRVSYPAVEKKKGK